MKAYGSDHTQLHNSARPVLFVLKSMIRYCFLCHHRDKHEMCPEVSPLFLVLLYERSFRHIWTSAYALPFASGYRMIGLNFLNAIS